RFVGDSPNIYVSCQLGAGQGDFSNVSVESPRGIDRGYDNRPRFMRDVNGDGRADFCRHVGVAPEIYLACDVSLGTSFSTDTYGPHFGGIIDPGYDWGIRENVDVNGDGMLDYCRFVGPSSNIFLSCQLGIVGGYSSNGYGYNSVQSGFDRGYD